MNQGTQSYAQRFGGEIQQIIANSAAPKVVPQESRYSRWFDVDAEKSITATASGQKLVQITPNMTVEQITAATLNNLKIIGRENTERFASKLPAGHRMTKPREYRPTLIKSAPYLGACKIGEVIVDRVGDNYVLNQFFFSNFEAELDTSGKAEFYNLTKRDFDEMYYGVNIIVDKIGNPIGFDRNRGEKGISFQTKSPGDALYEVAAAATGKTVEQLRQIAASNRAAGQKGR